MLTLSSATATGSRFVYTYGKNSYVLDLYNNNTLSIHETYFLESSRVDSSVQYNEEGDTTTEKYSYNGAGQIAGIKEYSYTSANGSVPSDPTSYM